MIPYLLQFTSSIEETNSIPSCISTKNLTFAPALLIEKGVIDNENLSTYTCPLPGTAGHNKCLGMIYFLSYITVVLLTSLLNIVSSHGLPYFQKNPLPAQNNS